MQTVLEQGSIDKPLTFDVGLIQLSFIPVCSLNTCNISVKLCQGFAALQCFSLLRVTGCHHVYRCRERNSGIIYNGMVLSNGLTSMERKLKCKLFSAVKTHGYPPINDTVGPILLA